MGAAMTAVSQMDFTVKYDNEAHRKCRGLCGRAVSMALANVVLVLMRKMNIKK